MAASIIRMAIASSVGLQGLKFMARFILLRFVVKSDPTIARNPGYVNENEGVMSVMLTTAWMSLEVGEFLPQFGIDCKGSMVSMAKRTVSITAKMTAEDYAHLNQGSRGDLARSVADKIKYRVGLAKLGADTVLKGKKK